MTMRTVSYRELGFSLIEALVALLVLSVGLLGLASLQTISLKFNQQSYQKGQAIYLAYDIVDRMRANRTALAAGTYDNIAASAAPPALTKNCTAALCNTSELATYDINKWKTSIANLLVSGSGSISTAGTRRTVVITWLEGDQPASFTLEAEL